MVMSEFDNLFMFNLNGVKPEKGSVLISKPFLDDDCFDRSVVLLTASSNEGEVGFILNKPSYFKLNELLDGLEGLKSKVFENEVFIGGPVSNDRVYYLHTVPELLLDSDHVLGNLYWGRDFEALKHLVALNKIEADQVRFFMGYSGWGAGQLEDEIKESLWLVSTLDTNELMLTDKADVWEIALNRLGGKCKIWANFPKNQSLN